MLRKRLQTLVRLATRIVAGTAIYTAIVALAAPLPAAAGLMLTFPALNGLAFYFSEDERAASIARTMFWMPVVNGTFCAAYIMLFLLLARGLPPTAVGWGLLILAAASWYAWVSRSHVRAGIAPAAQSGFAIAATLAGIALAALTILAISRFGVAPQAGLTRSPAATGIGAAIVRGEFKIELFAATLAVFVAAIQYYPMSDSTRGILAGLPIVPFGGLLSIAGDAALNPDVRTATLLGMAGGVWLGPPVAIWFIFCLSRYLSARSRIVPPAADSLVRFAALVVAWLATFAMMVATAYAVKALYVPAAPP